MWEDELAGMRDRIKRMRTELQRLRSEFGVYGVDSGRICVAALNDRNLDVVVAAISRVTEKASA